MSREWVTTAQEGTIDTTDSPELPPLVSMGHDDNDNIGDETRNIRASLSLACLQHFHLVFDDRELDTTG